MLLALAAASLTGCSDYEYTERTVTDVYKQPDVQRSADVLFVIDDSASMAEEQALLGENFEAFVDVVEGTYADFQLGIITTDVAAEGAGVLRGGILTPDTEDLAAVFLENITVGVDGSRDEQGFEAARIALSPATNPGLVRDEAQLNVVFFSDEDDHSPDAVEVYVDEFGDLSGDGGFAAHAIVGDLPSGCASGTSAASAADRYVTAVLQTAGYRDSICADDYTGILTRIGLDLSGLDDTFPLTELPDPGSIVVWVDGVRMHEREEDGWTYDAGDNAIVFHGRAIPRPGMEIFVEYELLLGVDDPPPPGG